MFCLSSRADENPYNCSIIANRIGAKLDFVNLILIAIIHEYDDVKIYILIGQ